MPPQPLQRTRQRNPANFTNLLWWWEVKAGEEEEEQEGNLPLTTVVRSKHACGSLPGWLPG